MEYYTATKNNLREWVMIWKDDHNLSRKDDKNQNEYL